MKKIFRKFLGATALGLGISLLVVSFVLAANLNYNADQTISLSSPAINLTILNGSGASSLVVNAGTIVVGVPDGSHFTITSASRDLSVAGTNSNVTVGSSCDSSQIVTVTITASGGSGTYTLTPTSGKCVYTAGGGGGGGGGGGSGSPSTTPTTTTPTTTTPTTTTPTTTTPTTSTHSSATSTAAPAGAHPNGTLVNDSGTIYVIKDGQRYGFRDANEYKSHGYSFGQAVAANATDKGLPMASGNIVKALEGTLVLDASDGKTVYMVGTNNTKRGFTSATVFKSLGYTFSNLLKVNLADYAAGTPIASSTDSHPNGALLLGSDNRTVWWSLDGQLRGFESMAVFNTYGFATSRIVKGNAADLAFPQGQLVKFRDGTLVKDGSAYYLISDGKKLAFASTNVLTSKGYKTSNAISASLANYQSGEGIN